MSSGSKAETGATSGGLQAMPTLNDEASALVHRFTSWWPVEAKELDRLPGNPLGKLQADIAEALGSAERRGLADGLKVAISRCEQTMEMHQIQYELNFKHHTAGMQLFLKFSALRTLCEEIGDLLAKTDH